GDQTKSKITPEAFRKTLQRARGKFLELLIQELRETIHPSNPEDIEAEIFDLGLGHLYRRYSAEAKD
ncbi:MAG TPA: sigma-70 family RNA polymerase sigma factor, partial [Isosphaeraceae bacterium]